MKKKIRPHKGGRTVRITIYATPETKEKFMEINESAGDIFEWAVNALKRKKVNQGKAAIPPKE